MELYMLNKFLSVTYRLARRNLSKTVHNFGLSSTQADILLYLADNPELNQKQLATAMVLDPSLIGRDISKLEDKNLVRRRIDPQDSRSRILILSQEGIEIVSVLREKLTKWWKDNLGKFLDIPTEDFFQIMSEMYLSTKKENN
ncbi:MarR family transcriptional regulator [Pediococcus stilesii]|uniref:MarR family transcriptional regulator n=1 Tax=Pediococcus stilesii TaxID=331679 RepID=A0A5R9BUA7_9LACO|nr:MarR family transcriptional regulator [Pediococcus stilesii]TLQ04217.1 MarR family transcriptional regulator [Pediococcus stilesii]